MSLAVTQVKRYRVIDLVEVVREDFHERSHALPKI